MKHGRPGTYSNHGCRCAACQEAKRASAAAYYAAHREKAKALTRRNAAARQSRSVERAIRHRAQWTGPELEHVLRLSEDGTRWSVNATQAALDLGRTVAAVHSIRKKARRLDPTPTMIAGLPDATKELES